MTCSQPLEMSHDLCDPCWLGPDRLEPSGLICGCLELGSTVDILPKLGRDYGDSPLMIHDLLLTSRAES